MKAPLAINEDSGGREGVGGGRENRRRGRREGGGEGRE